MRVRPHESNDFEDGVYRPPSIGYVGVRLPPAVEPTAEEAFAAPVTAAAHVVHVVV